MRIFALSPLHLFVIFVFLPFLLSLAFDEEGTCGVGEGTCPSEGDETNANTVSPPNEAKDSPSNKKKLNLFKEHVSKNHHHPQFTVKVDLPKRINQTLHCLLLFVLQRLQICINTRLHHGIFLDQITKKDRLLNWMLLSTF